MRVGGEVTEPVEISRVAPDYSRIPDSARGLSVCIFEAVIDKSGAVINVHRLRPRAVSPKCKPVLDEIARTLPLWRYRPATYKGRVVSAYLTITVTHCTSCMDE